MNDNKSHTKEEVKQKRREMRGRILFDSSTKIKIISLD
jgi:hypothetical protein